MPTGYTAGILDGTIKTFPEFAKTCMRAFGATIHMRDESFDKKYEPRKPSDYHKKELSEANAKLKRAEKLSDKQIIKSEKSKLTKDIKHYSEKIKEIAKQRKVLDKMLDQAKSWIPPTSEHKELKDFMINQLRITIKQDGDIDYYNIVLVRLKDSLKNISAEKIRQDTIQSAKENIEYHTKHFIEELERCDKSNKWVEDLIGSLNTK